ncbi:hypothetical protein MesoLjLb_29180 [Mesorhizobium sp. L-8-3]|nr:hypothetical protein MesoLjLb_29180 [Mesorhizobium sp. L-8-3]
MYRWGRRCRSVCLSSHRIHPDAGTQFGSDALLAEFRHIALREAGKRRGTAEPVDTACQRR